MHRRFLTLITAACLLLGAFVTFASTASAATLPTPTGLPAGIEPLADYVPQTSCDPSAKPGSVALGNLLVRTYRGTSFGSAYACATDGTVSEHYEGRAVDWMASVRNKTQLGQARAFLSWLFAKDRAGHANAKAR